MNNLALDPGTILLVIGGLMIGSFLNVCIYRLPLNKSIVSPRSHCPACGHVLSARENIPVISYLLLRGRCSACRTRISTRYPLIEILTAAVFVIVHARFGWSAEFVVYLVFATLLIVITFIDLDHLIIPNGLLLFGLLPGFAQVLLNWEQATVYLAGGIGLGVGFYMVARLGTVVFKKESMGMGDVKYAALIGLVLGWPQGLVAVFAAFFSALLMIIILQPLGRVSFSQRIPFGPFLSLGAFTGFLGGNEIIQWYLRTAF